MNENARFSRMLVMLLGTVLLFSSFDILPVMDVDTDSGNAPLEEVIDEVTFELDSNNNPDISNPHGTRASSRTVLVELFTNWGCDPCKWANPALNELVDTYDSSDLVMISYHTLGPNIYDPFYWHNSVDNDARVGYYGISTVPSALFDGPPNCGHNTADSYNYYKNFIETELAISSPMEINLEGYLNLDTSVGFVNASIEITDTLPSGSLKIRFVVVEDNLYAEGSNKEVRHRNVMREMLTDTTLPALGVGEFFNVSRSFPLNSVWDEDKISIVVFVQNDDDMDVLQAASYDYIPQKILVVDDDASTNPYGYEDDYHELMCEMELSFDGWVLNEKGSPMASDLIPYDVVIWVTGTASSSTLTSLDQLAISGYLDGGTGSLFLCGESIGNDIGASAFFSDYLHANFVSGNVGENQITGVDNDPISDTFYGGDIPISSNSPSEINPGDYAKTTFRYSSSGKSGAIRAVHDLDSRVVYFAYLYFESTDTSTNKMTMMENVLDWLNIDIDYILIRDAPDGGGDEVTSTVIYPKQSTTFWAAAYNNNLGFIENCEFAIWTEDSSGMIITVTSPGDSTFVQSGIFGGIPTITADFLGLQDTTQVIVPSFDSIKLTNAPNGAEITIITIGAGASITAYASGYNNTYGFLGLTEVGWSEPSGLGSFDTLTGTSTTFTAGLTGGMTTITGTNTTFGLSDSFDVNVIEVTADYIEIRNEAGQAGSIISNLILNVGESKQLWAAAYNLSVGYIGNIANTTWSEDSAGTVINISTPGASTTVQAQLIGGTATITVDLEGVQNTTFVTVNPPTVDYILVRDESGGGGDNLCDSINYPSYPVGHTTMYFGAEYNYTADYIGDVPVGSNWYNNNPSIVETSPTGSYTPVIVSNTTGGIAIIALNDGNEHDCFTIITVLPPTIDIIIIRDFPNGQGSAVSSPLYDVGDDDIFYTGSYNHTAGYLGDVIPDWDCTDDSVGNITALGEELTFLAVSIGNCEVTAEYEDKVDTTGIITVVDMTLPTAKLVTVDTIDEDASIFFNASTSHDNSGIVDYYWDFGDGEYKSGPEPTTTYVYEHPGTYTVVLTVTDYGGNTDYDETTIIVNDVTSPTVVLVLPDFAEEKLPCHFDGSGSSDNVGIVKYIWDFGDGNIYEGIFSNVTHIYENVGEYTVNITVKDGADHSDLASSSILVRDLTPPSSPKGVKVQQVNTGEALIIIWNPVTDIDLDHYELYTSFGNASFIKLADIDKGVTSYLNENLINGHVHRYYLKAVDTSGNPSQNSLIVTGIPDVDSDLDGIYDNEDYDDDNDGLSDDKEFEIGSDPLNPDTDGDKRLDGTDAFPTNSKEWRDNDKDGYGDSHEDAFPMDPDEWEDSDGDGIGDKKDFLPGINNWMLWILIALVIVFAVLGVFAFVKKKGKKRRESFSFESEEDTTPPSTQPKSDKKPPLPSSKPKSKSLPPPPKKNK